MEKSFWLKPKNKKDFLVRIMKELACQASIMFQGDISKCDFNSISGVSYSRRVPFQIMQGRHEGDFVIVPLESETVELILQQILPEERFIHQIRHIQIEKNGVIEFMAGDNFHEECISVGLSISGDFLKALVTEGILDKYETEEEMRKKYNR